MTYDPRWGHFKNMPTNLVGLSPTPMPTFSLIPQSMTKRIAGQLWRSASILELPKMAPRWPLNPNSWTSLLFPPPPPTNLMIIVSKYYKNPSRHIREEAFYDFGDTDRYMHAISSLNSHFPPLPYLLNFDAGATTVTTYILIENYRPYISQKNIYFSPRLHIPIIILKSHHWTTWTWVFWIIISAHWLIFWICSRNKMDLDQLPWNCCI